MATIHIVFGSQGAGKSTYSRQLAATEKAVYLSIDEWMWQLFGPDQPTPISMKWVMERVQRCEKRIWLMVEEIARAGGDVILDLGFMKVSDRDKFIGLAQAQNIALRLHYVDAAYALRRQQVINRNSEKGETFAFEVKPAMFDYMEKEYEPPTAAELKIATMINTD